MAENSNIEWTDHTFNPWHGCQKVSPGCKNCYMFAWKKRIGQEGTDRKRTTATYWRQAVKWNQDARFLPDKIRPRVFASLCDWLDDEVPIEWLADFLKLIYATPNLDWLLLTKRPENFQVRVLAAALHLAGYRDGQVFDIPIARTDDAVEMAAGWSKLETFPKNVWIGVSVEDQTRADERIPQLLKIPASIRFLSVEPLLEQIIFDYCVPGCSTSDWTPKVLPMGIHWVIVGGESGQGRRDCGVNAIVNVVGQCDAANVPVFVKQDCAAKPGQQGRISEAIWQRKQFPTQ